MEITYKIIYLDEVRTKQIPNLPKTVKTLIKEAIDERLTKDPIAFGKPLRFNLKGYRRLRVSDYRIVYWIDDEQKQVKIFAIKHRKDVYEEN